MVSACSAQISAAPQCGVSIAPTRCRPPRSWSARCKAHDLSAITDPAVTLVWSWPPSGRAGGQMPLRVQLRPQQRLTGSALPGSPGQYAGLAAWPLSFKRALQAACQRFLLRNRTIDQRNCAVSRERLSAPCADHISGGHFCITSWRQQDRGLRHPLTPATAARRLGCHPWTAAYPARLWPAWVTTPRPCGGVKGDRLQPRDRGGDCGQRTGPPPPVPQWPSAVAARTRVTCGPFLGRRQVLARPAERRVGLTSSGCEAGPVAAWASMAGTARRKDSASAVFIGYVHPSSNGGIGLQGLVRRAWARRGTIREAWVSHGEAARTTERWNSKLHRRLTSGQRPDIGLFGLDVIQSGMRLAAGRPRIRHRAEAHELALRPGGRASRPWG